jgi:hypothetical protein
VPFYSFVECNQIHNLATNEHVQYIIVLLTGGSAAAASLQLKRSLYVFNFAAKNWHNFFPSVVACLREAMGHEFWELHIYTIPHPLFSWGSVKSCISKTTETTREVFIQQYMRCVVADLQNIVDIDVEERITIKLTFTSHNMLILYLYIHIYSTKSELHSQTSLYIEV